MGFVWRVLNLEVGKSFWRGSYLLNEASGCDMSTYFSFLKLGSGGGLSRLQCHFLCLLPAPTLGAESAQNASPKQTKNSCESNREGKPEEHVPMNASRLEVECSAANSTPNRAPVSCSRVLAYFTVQSEQSGTPVLVPAAISIVTSEPAIEPEDTEPKTWVIAWGIKKSVGCFKRCAYARTHQQRAQRE